MHIIDLSIFLVYLLAMLAVGYYFLRRNQSESDYYVGGRSLGAWHIGLSVVATDVGGGFSIGLGGLGFAMGLSGSWMLFTGLIGAWLAGAFLIPRVHRLGLKSGFFTFPEVFNHFYGARVALIAALISALGYLGFTASQLLAGAKLASASFEGIDLNTALILMGLVAVIYTVMGGIKAVIYTDTIQWIILLSGLLLVALPTAYFTLGSWEGIRAELSDDMLSLSHLSWQDGLNWTLTILPIWFIGMTLYQRIYASRSEEQARKAWFIAGVFEWPVMAFLGVSLGMLARVAAQQGLFTELGFTNAADLDPELGLPMLLRTTLPVGLMGLVMAAYFSAILSTADSCLMACSGNVVSDLLRRIPRFARMNQLRLGQFFTLTLGALALFIALWMENVLELMLHSYAIMVSGLFVPLIFAVFGKRHSALAALVAMGSGAGILLLALFTGIVIPFGLDPIALGLLASLLSYLLLAGFRQKGIK